jgi:Fe-Mn family superoxide dismutase
MTPGGGGTPAGDAAKKIEIDFGGYDLFVQQFKDAALTQFGNRMK